MAHSQSPRAGFCLESLHPSLVHNTEQSAVALNVSSAARTPARGFAVSRGRVGRRFLRTSRAAGLNESDRVGRQFRPGVSSMSRVILRPHMVSALAGCLLACSAHAADPGAAAASCHRIATTPRRPGTGGRRRQGRRPCRRTESAGGNARPHRLHRRHQHGCPGRRRLCVRHPGRRTREVRHRHRLEGGGRRRRPARPADDRAEARRRDLQQRHRVRPAGQARRAAGGHRQHQQHRGPAAQLRGALARAGGLRQAADSLPRRRDRHGQRQDGGARRTATWPPPCAPAWRFRVPSRPS